MEEAASHRLSWPLSTALAHSAAW